MNLKQKLLNADEITQFPAIYDEIYIVPLKENHDSGWSMFVIVGAKYMEHTTLYAQCKKCDSLHWVMGWNEESLNTDINYPNGITHFWSGNCVFEIHDGESTRAIHLIPKPSHE